MWGYPYYFSYISVDSPVVETQECKKPQGRGENTHLIKGASIIRCQCRQNWNSDKATSK